jgi:hypothetical protein
VIAPGDLAACDWYDELSLYAIIAVPRSTLVDPHDNRVSAVEVSAHDDAAAHITHTLAHRGCNVIAYEV